MRYVSLFSGVEAATVAWSRLGWEPLAFAEVDEFPSAVLAHRFPNVPNLGDVREIDWKEFHEKHGAVDVLVGGSPCQSFSIAGGREGLRGESGLMFEYIRAVRELVQASGGQSPRYILWENVPGALSAERGNAFGQLLSELDVIGYGMAWRVFDAQFVRVPDRASGGFLGPVAQRRRRVFLVGVLGSPHAAEILFERESMRGNHPKGRDARKALAADAGERAERGCGSCGFCYHMSGQTWGLGYSVEQSPTLTSDYHSPAICLQSDGSTSTNSNGNGYKNDGSSYTLNLVDRTSVCFQQNQRDEVRLINGDGEIAGAVVSANGTKNTNFVFMASNGEDVVGSLCARDYKGIGNQCIGEGKLLYAANIDGYMRYAHDVGFDEGWQAAIDEIGADR